jgi:hypothetical protein
MDTTPGFAPILMFRPIQLYHGNKPTVVARKERNYEPDGAS